MDGAAGSEAPRRQDGDARSVLSAADGYRLGRRYFAPGRGSMCAREIRIAKVYEALDFLEKALDEKSAWLVRRYRRQLRWDRRNNREKEELREILRVTTRGIQLACVGLIVRRLNELAIHFRENKPSIDNLRQQLAIVRAGRCHGEN
jgi:ribosomal protein L22